MTSQGTTSYWFEINSENTVVGGFTGGSFPGIPWPVLNGEGVTGPPWSTFTAIKGVQSYTNFFVRTSIQAIYFRLSFNRSELKMIGGAEQVGVQGEPGRGKYFDFDSVSYENNVLYVRRSSALICTSQLRLDWVTLFDSKFGVKNC